MRADSNAFEKYLRPAIVQLLKVVLLPIVGLVALDRLVIYPLAWNNHLSANLAIVLVILPKIIVLPWIGFSTLRFTEEHYRKFGISIVKTSLLGCLFFAVMVISVSAIDGVQAIIFSQHAKAKASSGQSRPPEYRLSADMVKKEYSIEGLFDFGVTRDFRSLLQQYPGGTRVILASQGGSIYEGRGLAVLIREHKLDTHVDGECSSACTLAFLGGERRSIGAYAKLGFHQYSMEYLNRHQVTPFHDPQKEQDHDRVLMLERGIGKAFVDRVFEKVHEDIWYPDHATLLRYNVVHSIQ
jgi:hypothetical protein